MNAEGKGTAPGMNAEHVPTSPRLTAFRSALEYSGSAIAALIDMSAALTEARSPGLAWDTDHIADRIAAVAGEIARLAKVEARQASTPEVARGELEMPSRASAGKCS